MNYKIKPLEWRGEEYTPYVFIADRIAGRYYVTPKYRFPKNGEVDWDNCIASADWIEGSLAQSVSLEDAKKMCNDDHKKNLHKIIEDFVRIL